MEFIQNIKLPRIEKDHTLPIITIAAATAALFYSTFRLVTFGNKKNYHQLGGIKEIPTPGSCYPVVGHMMSVGELPGRFFSKWHQKLGPIIQIYMGRQRWVVIDCPVLAHKIFVTSGVETSYRPHSIYAEQYYSKGKGIVFAQPEASWRKCRSAALSILTPKEIDKYIDSMENESRIMVERLIDVTMNEGSVNPVKYLELCTLNAIFEICFGKQFDSIHDPDFERVAKMIKASVKFAGLENDLANFFPFLSVIDYFIGKQVKMRQFIYNDRNPFLRQAIQDAAALKEGSNLVKLIEEMECDLTEEDIIVLIFDLVVGGMDTLSLTLQWAIAILCHFPKVQEKISAEINGFIRTHQRLPNFKDRNEVPYCISVMKECIRYRSISPFGLPHAVRQDVEVDGYILPKGSILITNMESIHKNPERFPQGEQFIPERFMTNLKTMQSAANGKLENRDHFIFGWGRRLCPGIYMAEVQFFSSFVQIFGRCSIHPAVESQMPDIEGAVNGGLLIAPLPYKVKFSKRIDALV